jgi:hypothetical protein
MWQDIIGIAARMNSLELYERLRIAGFTKYASDVGRHYGRAFCLNTMCHPISEDLLKILANILKRFEESEKDISIFDAWGAMTLHSLHAYRSNEYHRVLSILEPQLKASDNENGETKFKQPWVWRMIGSMALARLNQPEKALSQYQEGLQIREVVYESEHLEGRQIFDLLKTEAERTLTECGIVIPVNAELEL